MSTNTKIQQSSKLIKEFLDTPIAPSDDPTDQRNILNIVKNASKVAQEVKKILREGKNKEYSKKHR